MGCLSAILIFFRIQGCESDFGFDQAQLLPRRAFAKKIPYQALKVGGYLYGCMALLPGRKGGRVHEEHYRPTLDLNRGLQANKTLMGSPIDEFGQINFFKAPKWQGERARLAGRCQLIIPASIRASFRASGDRPPQPSHWGLCAVPS